ncbi:hypothetical protein J27TS8_24440 [Robertmurraya siralis]|uniref:Bacterial Ig-like domain-containing protein n=1 Tax=Robertmurraya siralis TaxID=77777 RepID=A0A920BUC0_9BACI|nr:immunoglobulin-like domain-containing protein [Robertmurraya siralis]PAE20422.1 hypothetical protein CHH80_11475 [Bacillus sp. 7504-2]GIN62451.1 hypothetical protein J27TS8_24440 [Robertmurraya siralis]
MKNIYLFLLFLLLTGCSSDEITKPDVKGENIHNEIPQQLKAVDKTKLNTAIQYTSKSYLDLLDSAFFGDRDPKSFQQTIHRLYRPGEKFEINPNTLSRGGRYEVRFLKFNDEERAFETILEETVHRDDPLFTIQIPDDENVAYYIEQIAINKDNEVRKQEYHRLFVPYDELNAKIDLDKSIYSQGDTMIVTLKNLGTVEISTGYGIILEKWNGEGWEPYNFGQMVPAIAIIVRKNESFSQDVKLDELEKGTYRVIEELGENEKISVSFTME